MLMLVSDDHRKDKADAGKVISGQDRVKLGRQS